MRLERVSSPEPLVLESDAIVFNLNMINGIHHDVVDSYNLAVSKPDINCYGRNIAWTSIFTDFDLDSISVASG